MLLTEVRKEWEAFSPGEDPIPARGLTLPSKTRASFPPAGMETQHGCLGEAPGQEGAHRTAGRRGSGWWRDHCTLGWVDELAKDRRGPGEAEEDKGWGGPQSAL